MTDEIQKIKSKYQEAEKAYRDDPIWDALGTTPEKFYELVNERVAALGIDQREWQAKVNAAKQEIMTRINERHVSHQKYKIEQGLKA